MPFKNYREESKSLGWGSDQTQNLSLEQLQTGAILRIADATEKMAQNYARMENDLAMYKRWYEQEKATSERLYKSNAALRGHIKRLKKQIST